MVGLWSLAEHPYFNRSKVRASMKTNTEIMVNLADTPIDSTTREIVTVEKNQTLRHIMEQLWQNWANGQEPPKSILGFPEITSIRSSYSDLHLLRSQYQNHFSLQGMVHLIIMGPVHQNHVLKVCH